MASQQEDNPEDAVSLVFTEFKHFDEVMKLIKSIPCANTVSEEEHLEDSLRVIFNFYQEQPHLLDPFLERMITACLEVIYGAKRNSRNFHLSFRVLHFMIKTRGYKAFIRLMPHSVEEIEPTLAMLTEQNMDAPEIMQTRYVLLLWLSILVMLPFTLSTLDSDNKSPIVNRILTESKRYLSRDARTHQAAAFLLARLVTRPDVVEVHLSPLLSWCMDRIRDANCNCNEDLNQLCGILYCIANISKIGRRREILPYAPQLLSAVFNLPESALKSVDVCRLSSKVLQRIGLLFCSPRSTNWQYQRGCRSLADNLATRCGDFISSEKSNNYVNGCTEAFQPGKIEQLLDGDGALENPDAVAEIIGQLIGYLRSPFTVVRWSAAKGLGRISGRLSSALVDDVLSAILALCNRLEPFNAWHGACLALAELGRRSLLLPEKLPEVIPIVLRALFYDERSGDHNYGSNVRDAACYVCWAFARAYQAEDFAPYVQQVAAALVLVSLFDREVNVRRAGAAAYQENVGRQGQFPHGIEIITSCDYFAVRNRTTCFLQLSVFVAQFGEYVRPMIDHLSSKLLSHWDVDIRLLAARALHQLCPFDSEYMLARVIPQLVRDSTEASLYARQGNMFGVGELISALNKQSIDDNVVIGIKAIIPTLLQKNQFRGLGGDVLRRSACHLIQKVASVRLPVHEDPVVETWRVFLDSCVGHKESAIQNAAIDAYPALLTAYLYTSDGKLRCDYRDQVFQFLLGELQQAVSSTAAADAEKRLSGYLVVMAASPKDLFTGHVGQLFEVVTSACRLTARTQSWGAARADALNTLVRIHETLGVEHPEVDAALLKTNSCFLLRALSDYTVDRRGDIGSLVREAGMQCLQRFVTFLVASKYQELLDSAFVEEVMVNMAQQAVEKIDRTRGVAGQCFAALLHHQPLIPNIPHINELKAIFPNQETEEEMVWTAANETFPRFVRLLDLPEFRFRLLLGLSVSIGGLTEKTALCSAEALNTHLLKYESDEEYVLQILQTVEYIYQDAPDDSRIVLPLFKFLDFLLNNPVISAAVDPASLVLSRLLEETWSRSRLSANVQRIKAAVDIFGGMLQFSGRVRERALHLMMVWLDHRFPVVRKAVATKLYESLLVYFDIAEPSAMDQLTVLLTETVWESDLAVIRPIRAEVCQLLDQPVPRMTPPVVTSTPNKDT